MTPTHVTRIRTERPGDEPGIRRVHRRAFGRDDEADLVDALRGTGAWEPDLSLVAEEEGVIIGHVLLSHARLDTGAPVWALAPVSVLPEVQRRRVGTLLLDEGLRRAGETDHHAVVVLGDPEYYGRFGFEPAREFGILPPFDVPDDYWQAVRLPGWTPTRGMVVYPAQFPMPA